MGITVLPKRGQGENLGPKMENIRPANLARDKHEVTAEKMNVLMQFAEEAGETIGLGDGSTEGSIEAERHKNLGDVDSDLEPTDEFVVWRWIDDAWKPFKSAISRLIEPLRFVPFLQPEIDHDLHDFDLIPVLDTSGETPEPKTSLLVRVANYISAKHQILSGTWDPEAISSLPSGMSSASFLGGTWSQIGNVVTCRGLLSFVITSDVEEGEVEVTPPVPTYFPSEVAIGMGSSLTTGGDSAWCSVVGKTNGKLGIRLLGYVADTPEGTVPMVIQYIVQEEP